MMSRNCNAYLRKLSSNPIIKENYEQMQKGSHAKSLPKIIMLVFGSQNTDFGSWFGPRTYTNPHMKNIRIHTERYSA